MIVDAKTPQGTFIQKTSKNNYVVFSRTGLSKKDSDFLCETKSQIDNDRDITTERLVDDMTLRKFRLAVSASAEYTAFHEGTVADALAAINATVTRINQIFETDLGITLELIANNDQIIYLDSATDPYSGGDSLNTEVQTTLTNVIGEANYDIGHLFHAGINAGNAGFVGEICTDGRKGSAFSSAASPTGDTFDIDFVAHEIGHQLGANHTWSHEPEGTGVQVEPASGTTIMGYAGITGINNVALNSDPYLHYISILQITENLESKSCGEDILIANNPPIITAVPDYVIPALTAFILTGDATDLDADDQLTYTWEQIDNGIVTQNSFGPTNAVGANFRSLMPTDNPSRYFPSLSRVVAGNLTQVFPAVNSAWETATSLDRELNFALTVRDNAAIGGQVASELVTVAVKAAGGAFSVSSQATAADYTAGDLLEVNWNVADTDQAPISVQSVDILLSIDGGLSFPIVVAEQVLNDGSHEIILPGSATTEARLMVRANDNIFYAVNAADFTIIESAIVLNAAQTDYDVCQPDSVAIPFVYETYGGFSEEVTFSVLALPEGLSATFSPTTATANDTEVILTISNTETVEPGGYSIDLQAIGASETKQLPLQIKFLGLDFADVILQSPADGAAEVSARENLLWEDNELFSSYEIQISTDVNFANIVETAELSTNSFQASNLDNDADYFWRVKPKNSCGEGSFGTPFSFSTIGETCIPSRFGSGLPITISASGRPTITSTVTFLDDLALTDIEVGIELDHTYVGDLIITLTSPQGKSVVLVSNACDDSRNINAVFDDDAPSFICGSNPAISGTISPLTSFDALLGDSIAGDWTLTVEDVANFDGGALNNFFLNVCVEGEPAADEDGDGVSDVEDSCPGTEAGLEVDITGCAIYRFETDNFQLLATSESCRTENDGSVEIIAQESLNYEITITGNGLNVNDSFTADYIQNNLSAGTYDVCIDATSGDIEYEELCFEVVISEPEAISVSSQSGIDPNSIVLNLSGSDIYTVTVNGLDEQTTQSEFTLDLKPGNNSVTVVGRLACQGFYEKQFFIAGGIIIYPNPTSDYVRLFVENAGTVELNLFSMEGRLIRTEKRTMIGSKTELDVSNLSAGTYFLKVEGESQKGTYKIIKQ